MLQYRAGSVWCLDGKPSRAEAQTQSFPDCMSAFCRASSACSRHYLLLLLQVRIATRLGTKLISSDFNSREYYTNIRKAITAGYFMQVCLWLCSCGSPKPISLTATHTPCIVQCVCG